MNFTIFYLMFPGMVRYAIEDYWKTIHKLQQELLEKDYWGSK